MDWGIVNLFCGFVMIKLNQKVILCYLQVLVILVDINSFSCVVDVLVVIQLVLLVFIKQLENQFGMWLFDCIMYQISLIVQGSVVLEYVCYLFNMVSNIFDDIEYVIGIGCYCIWVGVIFLVVMLMVVVIVCYNQVYDEYVEILLQDMFNDVLLDVLYLGKLDFCVGIKLFDLLFLQMLEMVILFEDELVLIVLCCYFLLGVKEVQWWQMVGEEIVLFIQGSVWEFVFVVLMQYGLVFLWCYQVVYSELFYGVVCLGIVIGIMFSFYIMYLCDDSLYVVLLWQLILKCKIVFMCCNEVSCSYWIDYCFCELCSDLKQVNYWF